MRGEGENEDETTAARPDDWLGDLGAGAIAAIGAGVFALSILAMVALDRVGGMLAGEGPPAQVAAPEAEGVAFARPEPAIAVHSPDSGAPAWMVHSAPFEAPADRPLMAVIVLDDGTRSDAAMRALGWRAPLSFAIAADFDLSPHRIERVRRAGREALALVPFGYGPDFGGDPNVLRRGLDAAELLRRLRWHLARAGEGIIGIVDRHGGDLLRDAQALHTVGDALAGEGMMVVDSRSDPGSLLPARLRPLGVPVGRRTVHIPRGDTQDAVFGALSDARDHAATWGTAIALVEAGEGTMDALAAWMRIRGEEVALAPVSHVIRRLRRGPQVARVQPE